MPSAAKRSGEQRIPGCREHFCLYSIVLTPVPWGPNKYQPCTVAGAAGHSSWLPWTWDLGLVTPEEGVSWDAGHQPSKELQRPIWALMGTCRRAEQIKEEGALL